MNQSNETTIFYSAGLFRGIFGSFEKLLVKRAGYLCQMGNKKEKEI